MLGGITVSIQDLVWQDRQSNFKMLLLLLLLRRFSRVRLCATP